MQHGSRCGWVPRVIRSRAASASVVCMTWRMLMLLLLYASLFISAINHRVSHS